MSAVKHTQKDFKDIGTANWHSPDEQTSTWMQVTAVAKNPGEWVQFFLRPTLKPGIPRELGILLEVARGAMIYGWFFYPLVTLGAEQCWRVLESGVRLRCQQVGIRPKRFDDNIKALSTRNLIPNKSQWHAVRALRNSTSHPSRQMILDPGQAQGVLQMTVSFLNELFPS